MSTATELPVGTWHLDPSSTTVTVSAKMLGFLNVPATLDVVSGSIEIDDNHQVSKVEVAVDASSYASNNAKRNEHVRGADFLDSADHPTIRFQTSGLTSSATGYTSNGTVTIKGQSSPLAVSVSEVNVSGQTMSFTATSAVNRKAAGVDKMPGLIISDTVQLNVEATALLNS